MTRVFILAFLPVAAGAEAPVVFPEVTDVAHAGLIGGWDDAAFERGRELYQKVCFACHGVDGKAATVQGARAFAVDPLKHKADPYSLFKTISFNFDLDPVTAADPANYQIEIWNYRWTRRYGSKFYSVKSPETEGTDKLEVTAAVLGADHRSVRLSIPELVPCDQLKAVLDLRDHTGEAFRQEFHQTIHRLADK